MSQAKKKAALEEEDEEDEGSDVEDDDFDDFLGEYSLCAVKPVFNEHSNEWTPSVSGNPWFIPWRVSWFPSEALARGDKRVGSCGDKTFQQPVTICLCMR